MTYAVLDKYPNLKQMLEQNDQADACHALFLQMSDAELAELKRYISERFSEVEHSLWQNAQSRRNIQALEQHMQEDKKRIAVLMGHLGYELNCAFSTIYANPHKAQQATWSAEQKKGLPEVADLIRKRPGRFGSLKGLSLFGFKLFGREKAITQAKKTDYKSLRLGYAHGQSMLAWLSKMLGDEEKKNAA